MTDTKDKLAALKNKKVATPEAQGPDTSEVLEDAKQEIVPEPVVQPQIAQPAPTVPAQPVMKDSSIKEYQQYSSARISTCLVTPSGIRINFTDYSYYTSNKEIIAYLDKTISDGSKAIKRGMLVSADEINPAMAAKRKIIEEFKASQAGRDFSGQGQVDALAAAGKLGGAGTGTVSTPDVPIG